MIVHKLLNDTVIFIPQEGFLMQSKLITYKDIPIFIVDYTNYHADHAAMFKEVEAAHQFMISQPPDSLRIIIDITNTVADLETVNLLKDRSKAAQPMIKKTAIVGLGGVKKTLAESVVRFSGLRNTKFFDTREQAQEYFVE
jgi:hypothetical protein